MWAAWIKQWGALILGAAGFALGIFNLNRTSAISRAEKRTQLVVDIISAQRQLQAVDDELTTSELEWARLARAAPDEEFRNVCEERRENVARHREVIVKNIQELDATTKLFEAIPESKLSQMKLEEVRRRYVKIKARSDEVLDQIEHLRRRLVELRDKFSTGGAP